MAFSRFSCAVLALLTIPAGRAESQILPGFGYMPPFARDAMRQQRAYERQQVQAERQAAAREHTPHVVSALFSGQLGPVADLRSLAAGKTLYLERPIVADHQLVRMQNEEIYLASNGTSHSPAWSGAPWTITQNEVCMAISQQQRCLQALQDSAGQVFFVGPNNLLAHLVRTGNGDSAGVVTRYAQNQRQARANDEAATKILEWLGPALLGGGGGGGSNDQSSCRYLPYPDGKGMYKQC